MQPFETVFWGRMDRFLERGSRPRYSRRIILYISIAAKIPIGASPL